MNEKWYVMDITSNTGGVQEFDTEEQADTVGAIMAEQGQDNIVYTLNMFENDVLEYEQYRIEQLLHNL